MLKNKVTWKNASLRFDAADFPGNGLSRLPVTDGAAAGNQAAPRGIGSAEDQAKARQIRALERLTKRQATRRAPVAFLEVRQISSNNNAEVL